MARRWSRLLVVATAVALVTAAALAQDFGFGGFGPRGPFHAMPNARYDGRFTFVRVHYETAPGGYWYRGWPAWAHGYPIAEQNLMKIMNEVSYLGARDEEINTLALDDPELCKYPVAYIIEVGWWQMTDREAAALRAYLQKGGFVIVDDFKVRGFGGGMGGGGWEEIVPQAYNAGEPIFRGVYEDNDPAKRLLMIVNYNTDISQFWEWSGTGLRPIDDTNEAYKLGVNYLIYGLTH